MYPQRWKCIQRNLELQKLWNADFILPVVINFGWGIILLINQTYRKRKSSSSNNNSNKRSKCKWITHNLIEHPKELVTQKSACIKEVPNPKDRELVKNIKSYYV
jgi:hypothetical protein